MPQEAGSAPVNGIGMLAVLTLLSNDIAAAKRKVDVSRFYGSYRVSASRVIWIGPFVEFGTNPFLLDFESGRFAPLYASSQNTFFAGKTIGSADPSGAEITFTPGGLKFRENDRHVTAKKVATRREDVTFRNGNTKLAGNLTLPTTRGPHPAIVLIHGSNAEDRDYLRLWADYFATQGLAVIAYDKRGVRDSSGDWKRASFDDLAGDALAGVHFLERRKDIDVRRIGLFGISQGGWIAPLVASRARNIAFIILHAGSGLSVGDNGLAFIDAELRGYGFPDEEIAAAMAYYRLNDDVTRSPERWEDLQKLYQTARARNVEWLIEEPQPKDFWFREMYRGMIDFDPAPLWPNVSAPILAFLGELDSNVPAAPNRVALDAAMKQNSDATVIVLPKANHLFLRAQTGVRTEYPELSHFVGGYFDVMTEWIATRITSRVRSRSSQRNP